MRLLAGGPATNYTLRAWHTDYPDICSTATVSTVLIELMPEHSAFRAVMKSHGPATNVFSVVSSDGELPDWKIEPDNLLSGARIGATASSSYGSEVHDSAGHGLRRDTKRSSELAN